MCKTGAVMPCDVSTLVYSYVFWCWCCRASFDTASFLDSLACCVRLLCGGACVGCWAADINSALTAPFAGQDVMDDDELLAELEDLEQEKVLQSPPPSLITHPLLPFLPSLSCTSHAHMRAKDSAGSAGQTDAKGGGEVGRKRQRTVLWWGLQGSHWGQATEARGKAVWAPGGVGQGC